MAQNYRTNYQNNGKRRTMGSNGRDGLQDWKCQACSVLNRHFRVRCFGCDKLKSFSSNNFGDSGQQYTIKTERYDAGGDSNDWICKNYNCAFSNRHFRLVCLKCRRPKSNNHATQNHNITGRNDESGGDSTDWICTNSSCEFSNGQFRSVCFKCRWPNPDSDRKLRSVSKATVAENKSSTTKNEVGDGTMASLGLPSSFGAPRLKTEPVSGDLTSINSESPNEFGSSNRDVGGDRLPNTTDKHWACPHCKFFLNDLVVSHCDNCNHSKPTLPSQEASENVKCIKVENDLSLSQPKHLTRK